MPVSPTRCASVPSASDALRAGARQHEPRVVERLERLTNGLLELADVADAAWEMRLVEPEEGLQDVDAAVRTMPARPVRSEGRHHLDTERRGRQRDQAIELCLGGGFLGDLVIALAEQGHVRSQRTGSRGGALSSLGDV
jgi:hypothetical protein